MKYIGFDCHKQYDHATIIDTETGEIRANRLPHIKEEFKAFKGDRAYHQLSEPPALTNRVTKLLDITAPTQLGQL